MTIHVVGAGLAGLAAAVEAAGAGRAVQLYEAAGQAGGRCRSIDDPVIGRRIDNGNHLVLSGNRATIAYLRTIDAGDALVGPERAVFPFLDLPSGARWQVSINRGPAPLWPLFRSRRPPDTIPRDFLALLRLLSASRGETVTDVVPAAHPLHRSLVAPIATAVLNARPEEGAAALLGRALSETMLRGGGACRPLVARRSLEDAFVAPAIAWLRGRGIVPRMNQRLRAMSFGAGGLEALRLAAGSVELGRHDAIVLAVPPAAAAELVPGLLVPQTSRAILNAHFRLPSSPRVEWAPFLGLTGGLAEWLFVRGDVLSVTVSAADGLIERSPEDLAAVLWRDVARALALVDALPPFRIIKERRATFAQIPPEVARRPAAATAWPNLFLAGDWTDTGLPATIEGAIRSGREAVRLALGATVRER